MKHKHKWTEYLAKAVGYWQKRECPGDGLYFHGRVEICMGCQTFRFVCDDPRYRIVEVEKP